MPLRRSALGRVGVVDARVERVRGGIDLVLPGSGLTAIIGPSGTGKSTLIRCINRLVQPTSGEILFRGQDLAKLSGRSLRSARKYGAKSLANSSLPPEWLALVR